MLVGIPNQAPSKEMGGREVKVTEQENAVALWTDVCLPKKPSGLTGGCGSTRSRYERLNHGVQR